MKSKISIHRLIIIFILLLFILCGENVSQTQKEVNSNPEMVSIPVIYETDITLDVDDAGALAVLYGLQMEKKVNLLGVCYNEVHPAGPSVIDAINTYYGYGNLPIGIYQKQLKDPDPSDYFSLEKDFDVDDMPHNPMDNIVGNAVGIYKHLLRSQTDNSVTIISVGFLNNLYELLQDPEGVELVERKVKLLAVMGGLHNDGFNFVRHNLVDQTQYVIENWPGELVITDAGGEMITGETLSSETPVHNPVRRAYELEWYQGPDIGRSSWDQVTVLYAVFGTELFQEDWVGNGSLPNGYKWDFSPGRRGYAAPINEGHLEQKIEELMTKVP